MTLKVDNIQNENSSEANVVLNTDGSIAVPSQIQHVGDTDTLIEFGTGNIQLHADGAARVTTTSTTTTVTNDLRCDVDLEVGDRNSSSGNFIWNFLNSGGNNPQLIVRAKNTAQDTSAIIVAGKHDNTDAFQVHPNGDVTIDGNLKVADGKGINFHNYGTGTNIDSNLLDDYEEGTWTPQLEFGGGSTGLTGTQLGSYTKIGNRVYILCSVVLTAKGTSTGVAKITGLPFTSIGASTINYHNSPLSVTFFSLNSLNGGSARTQAGGTNINLFREGTVDLDINNTHFNNTSQIQIAGFYETTA